MKISYFKDHCFMPSHTIYAVILMLNQHSLSQDEMDFLLAEFNNINENRIPIIGQSFKIPILQK